LVKLDQWHGSAQCVLMNKQAQINLYEAKTQLSSLVERAAAGEEIVIAKNGKPMARLIPLGAANRPVPWGDLKGRVTISDADLMAPLPEADWQGGVLDDRDQVG
jgi:prevent-host-death family protein